MDHLDIKRDESDESRSVEEIVESYGFDAITASSIQCALYCRGHAIVRTMIGDESPEECRAVLKFLHMLFEEEEYITPAKQDIIDRRSKS